MHLRRRVNGGWRTCIVLYVDRIQRRFMNEASHAMHMLDVYTGGHHTHPFEPIAHFLCSFPNSSHNDDEIRTGNHQISDHMCLYFVYIYIYLYSIVCCAQCNNASSQILAKIYAMFSYRLHGLHCAAVNCFRPSGHSMHNSWQLFSTINP